MQAPVSTLSSAQLPLVQLPGPQAFGPATSLDGSRPERMPWPASPGGTGGTTFSGHLPVPADPNGRAAVCSTMKDVRGRIDSWVRWHLWLGFSRLYIFFDDSTETASIEAAKAAAEPWGERAVVALLRGSEALRAAWARQPSWASMGMNANRDVQVRQLLNAQLAMELARADGLTWLLHLDSDELFLPRNDVQHGARWARSEAEEPRCEPGAVVAHFAALAAAGCECFLYHNYEGVPTHVDEPRAATAATSAPTLPGNGAARIDAVVGTRDGTSDPFVSLEVFKQCEARVEWRSVPETARALEQWRARSHAGKLFLYYENGKCACRVDTDGNWVPVNVHLCLPRLRCGKWDAQRMQLRGWTNDVRNAGMRHHVHEASAVLHFPVWEPEAFWRKCAFHRGPLIATLSV